MKLIKTILLIITLAFWSESVLAQSRVVSGKVTELINGKIEPMYGVNVVLMNNQQRFLTGVTTDMNGVYNLAVPESTEEFVINYSFIGMKTQTIKYTGQRIIDIQLEADQRLLDEFIVTEKRVERNDLGISQKEQTSATQKIEMSEIVESTPASSIEELLQGQLGGVDIVVGGDPGARSAIRIRGTSSLNASSEPLIVINGVPYDTDINEDFDFATANEEDFGALLNISPSDIQEIEVLKDAAATAVWGTKGGNGVLLIKTKKGTAGRTRFMFSTKFNTSFEPKNIPMLDGNEYVALMQDGIWNSANAVGIDGSTASNYLRLLFDTPEINYNPDWRYFNEYNQNTKWLDLVRQTAYSTDNSFSMSGGGEKASYRLALSYLNENGTTIGNTLERYTALLDISYDFSQKLRIGAEFSFSHADKEANWTNVRSEALRKMPNKSPYWIDSETGEYTSQYFSRQIEDFQGEFNGSRNFNPVAMAKEGFNNTTTREEKITFRLEYDILPELRYDGWVSLTMRTVKNRKFLPQIATGVLWSNTYANASTDAMSDVMQIQTKNQLSFRKNFSAIHNLIANAILRTSQIQRFNYSSATSGNVSSSLSDPIAGSVVSSIGSGSSDTRSVSIVGNVNYTLMDRYVFNAVLNVEGNSAMGRSNRWGYFPAFGAAWNMQYESWLEDKEWLTEMKPRFSYGFSGNSPSGASLFRGAYRALGSYMDMSAIEPVRMQLDNLKWETSQEYNIGIDLGFLQGRLSTNFEYYRKKSKDLLQRNVSIPSTTGYGSISYFNSGELINRGWEFILNYQVFKNKDWNVSARINLSRNRNEITKLPENLTQENYSLNNGKYAVRVMEGNPIGSFYGYKYQGVYQNTRETYARDREGSIMTNVQGNPIVTMNNNETVYPGDAKYQDINYDGVINEYDIVYLGNAMPILTTGATIRVRYKDLALSAFFHGRIGQKVINEARMNSEAMYNSDNQSRAVLRRWRNEGDDTDIPRALYNMGYNYLGSDRFVESCSYVRLKTLTFTYYIPKQVTQRWGIGDSNVFLTGYNLFTWTNYKGQDPEVSLPSSATALVKDTSSTPVPIKISCGINITF